MITHDAPNSQLLLYQTEDVRTHIECRFEGEVVWRMQGQHGATPMRRKQRGTQ